jgi:hypothetical protein
MPNGTKYALATYRGISANFKLPPYRGSLSYTFTFADATGKNDIGKFHGQRFPLYPHPGGDSSCPGTAFVYVGLRVTGPGPLLTSGASIFTYRNEKRFPGNSCGGAELTGGEWYAFGVPAVPKGDRLSFDSAINYKTGAVAIAVYCN